MKKCGKPDRTKGANTMKKVTITAVLFLMMFSVPVMAGARSSSGKCLASGCNAHRCQGSFYCSSHKCAESSCKNKRASGSIYCSKHKTNSYRKTSSISNSSKSSSYRSKSRSSSGSGKPSFDPDDHDIEAYYDDYRDEYDDYDDAYDGFLDDEDAWDDY